MVVRCSVGTVLSTGCHDCPTQSPQLRLSSRARMQILTFETARTVWDFAEVEGERECPCMQNGLGICITKDCRRMSVDIQ